MILPKPWLATVKAPKMISPNVLQFPLFHECFSLRGIHGLRALALEDFVALLLVLIKD
jgi:hypothetical protein